jgi:acylphosphatase
MFTEIYCVVTGRVQSVGYRDFVDTYAKDNGLTGWVKNNQNGSVELVLQGTPDALKDCIEIVHEGSILSKVEALTVDWRTPKQLFDSFRVIAS